MMDRNTCVLLKGAVLIDGIGGPPVADSAVLVEGRRIRYAGPASGLDPIPLETETIELPGCAILPGLMNSHVHLALNPYRRRRDWSEFKVDEIVNTLEGYELAKECIEHGVTALGDLSAPHHGFIKLGRMIENGDLTGPRIVAVGRALIATGGHSCSLGREIDGPAEAAKAVREEIKAGAHQIKLMAEAGTLEGALDRQRLEMTVAEMTAATEAAHAFGRTVRAHLISAGPIREGLAVGVDVIEHGYAIDDRGIDWMVEHGNYLVPTIQVWKKALLNPERVPTPQMLVYRKQTQAVVERTLPRAIEAGVRIALGTDGSTLMNPAGDVLLELQSLVEYGMTPMQAIRAATLNAAEVMDLDQDLGSLQKGKLADLIVVEGDPASEIDALARVRLTMVDGRILKHER